MDRLTDQQAACLQGGRSLITVAPTIVVSTAVNNVLMGNLGGSAAIALLGANAESGLAQINGLSLTTMLA